MHVARSGFLGSALVLLAGCQNGQPWSASDAGSAGDTGAQMHSESFNSTPTVHNTANRASSIDFGGEDVTPPPDDIDRSHAALVGLYGELISDSAEAGGQLDGGSNLSQSTFATEGACYDPDLDRTGSVMVFASTMHRTTPDIYLKSTTGTSPTQLTSDPADDVQPSISPDGERVAFASNRSGNWDIYVMSINGGQTLQITNNTDHDLHPTWSPDGSMLAFCRFGSQSQRWEMWMVEWRQPVQKRFLDYGLFPQWGPDIARSKILFQRARQRGSRFHTIWTIDIVNGEAMYPTEIVSAANAAVINPSWAPDGDRVVFATVFEPETDPGVRPAQADIWIVRLDGTGRTNLTNGQFANFQPVWSPNGQVYFVSDRSGADNIWSVSTGRAIDVGQPTPPGIVTADLDQGAD